MRLLISEFITGGGLVHDPLPDSLKQEGLMMLKALVRDCSKIPDLHITVTLDKRLSLPVKDVQIVCLDSSHDYSNTLQQLADQHHHTWIIAPETDNILSSLVSMLARHNVSLLNSDSSSVELCSDKAACDQHLRAAGLAVVPSLSIDQLQSFHHPVILKRRLGAGCEGMLKLESGPAALTHIKHALGDFAECYLQPYISGAHKSLSLLCLDGHTKILSCNTQTINFNHPVMLTSCLTNGSEITTQMQQLANDIALALPGLRLYVGVDFIETENCLYVVDVNPRLTSSYVGLSQCLSDNPAQLCINTHLDNVLPEYINRLTTTAEVKIA